MDMYPQQQQDEFFGSIFGKRARVRRKAKREAKKKGLKGRARRAYGQAAEAKYLREKASRKGGRKAKRLLRRAGRVEGRKGRSWAGKTVKNIGKVVTAPVRLAALALVKPFEKKMRNMLRKRGMAAPKKFKDVVKTFYNVVVAKKGSNFEPIDFNRYGDWEVPASDNVIPLVAAAPALVAKGAAAGKGAPLLKVIVDAIVKFFKNALGKAKRGEPMTPVEEEAAKGAAEVEKILEREAKAEASQRVGASLLFDKKTQMIIIIAIVGIVLLTRR